MSKDKDDINDSRDKNDKIVNPHDKFFKEKQEIKNIVNKLPQEIKSDIMTIAQSLIQKGRQEGIQEGIQEGEYMNKVKTIVNGYKAGATIKFLALQTELPEEEVKKILDENLN